MTLTGRNRQSNMRGMIRAALQMSLFLLLITIPPRAMGQQRTKKPSKKSPRQAESISKINRFIPQTSNLRGQTHLIKGDGQDNQISMQVTLDWTICQIHRVNNDEPLEIILSGTIESNSPEIWTLSPVLPKPEIAPNLHRVAGVIGEVEGNPEMVTPLEWKISVDKGPLEAMTLLPDNSLTYIFPAGQHCFQVHISVKLHKNQMAGYYQLQLAQSFAPQL